MTLTPHPIKSHHKIKLSSILCLQVQESSLQYFLSSLLLSHLLSNTVSVMRANFRGMTFQSCVYKVVR